MLNNVNNSSINMGMDKYTEVGLLINNVVLFLIFLGISIQFFVMAAPNYIPTNMYWCVRVLFSSPLWQDLFFLDNRHPHVSERECFIVVLT